MGFAATYTQTRLAPRTSHLAWRVALTSDPEQQRVKLREGLVHRAVGEEVFVLMADSTVHWLRNVTAVALWEALAGAAREGTTLSALSMLVVDRFEVEPARASADVTSFVRTLAQRGVVEWVSTCPKGPSTCD